MSIERFFNTPVTIVTPGSDTERYGDQVPDWDNPVSEVETFGWLTQVTTTEEIGNRNVVATGWKLFLAASETITVADRVVGVGKTFAVDGDPHLAPYSHHIEVDLRYVAEVEAEAGS